MNIPLFGGNYNLLPIRHLCPPFQQTIKEIIMTVKEHLIEFLDWKFDNGIMFKTHDIQDLSQRGLKKFGKRLGSPETYTRQFRELRQHNVYKIDKITHGNCGNSCKAILI